MATAMATIYYNLVKSGKRSIDQVPTNIREEVEAMLNEDDE